VSTDTKARTSTDNDPMERLRSRGAAASRGSVGESMRWDDVLADPEGRPQKGRRSMWRSRIPIAAGLVCVMLGTMGMAGSVARWRFAVEPVPGTTPIPFNSAVCLVAAGISLIAAERRWRRVAALLAGFVGILAGATLIEYLFGTDLRIDAVVGAARAMVLAGGSARMAPNAAIGFALAGVALVLGNVRHRPRWIGSAKGLTATSVGSIGTSALIGYMVGLKSGYTWGDVTAISLETSFGMIALAVGLLWLGVRDSSGREEGAPQWIPWAVGVFASVNEVAVVESVARLPVPGRTFGSVGMALNALIGVLVVTSVLLGVVTHLALDARRRARRIRREEAFNHQLLNALSDLGEGVVVTGGERIRFVNDGFCWISGYAPSDLLHLGSPLEIVAPDRRPDTATAWSDVLPAGDDVQTYETTILSNGGSRIDVEVAWKTLSEDVEARIFLVHDVTERKRAEEMLRRSEGSLAEAQRVAHLGNWEFDLVEDVLTWSDEIYRIFELDPQRFDASYEAFLGAIHPEDRELVDAAYRGSVENHQPYEVRHRLLMSDGEIKYAHERGKTFYDEDGLPVRSVGTVQDVTELVRAEEAVRALNADLEDRVRRRTAELEAANRELEAFSYSVSHDLRAPLRAIQGFARILQTDHADALDDEGTRVLGVVTSSVQRMAQLIDDLLAFSRVTRRELTMGVIDMSSLASDVVQEVRALEPDRDVEVVVSDLPEAAGDGALIRQAMLNLVGNAFKFTGPVARPRVEIRGWIEDAEAVYSVTDNGVGFDQTYADKLFQVFQRLHSSQEFDGTGIGLALVHRIVDRHGGRVGAAGGEGHGATFWFSLPLRTTNEEKGHEG
jgi:PAS domain S-box-containing protein